MTKKTDNWEKPLPGMDGKQVKTFKTAVNLWTLLFGLLFTMLVFLLIAGMTYLLIKLVMATIGLF